MSQTCENISPAPGADREREFLLRLYREIGLSAVAKALEINPAATRKSRISAQKLLDKRREDSIAA